MIGTILTTKMKPASALIALALLCGCAKKPVTPKLVAPPNCVKVLSDVPLTDDGKAILPNGHFDMQINCVRAVRK